MTTKDQWVWMPHPAHFILGHRCWFRLATYVGGYIVSTVGELDWPPSESWRSGFDTIGSGRLYETMVFRAESSDACDSCPWVITGDEQDFSGYTSGADAFAGHMAFCEKWASVGRDWIPDAD